MAGEARAKLASGIDPMEERKAQTSKIQEAAQNERRIKAGLPAIGSFEDVARRWFDVKSNQWMASYSSKVIRRLELHAFHRFGKAPIGMITPVTVLEACRAVECNDIVTALTTPIAGRL